MKVEFIDRDTVMSVVQFIAAFSEGFVADAMKDNDLLRLEM